MEDKVYTIKDGARKECHYINTGLSFEEYYKVLLNKLIDMFEVNEPKQIQKLQVQLKIGQNDEK